MEKSIKLRDFVAKGDVIFVKPLESNDLPAEVGLFMLGGAIVGSEGMLGRWNCPYAPWFYEHNLLNVMGPSRTSNSLPRTCG